MLPYVPSYCDRVYSPNHVLPLSFYVPIYAYLDDSNSEYFIYLFSSLSSFRTFSLLQNYVRYFHNGDAPTLFKNL